MSRSALAAGVRYLRTVVASQCHQQDSDERLLHAFLVSHDEAAFAALVRRYGPMVGAVCRRVLGHEQDAEDAFQATFLILAQNAARLRKKTALASFLHGTAYRIALHAKRTAARRRKHEGRAPARPSLDPTDELSWREVRALVDEEVGRLPEKYRSAFILCCLESVSQAEAAQRLGIKEGTLASRLSRARERLGQRLARRGVDLTAVLAAMALSGQSASALSPMLIPSTIKAALATAAGEQLASVASPSVAEMVKSATAAMMSKAKLATLLLLTATVLTGAGAWTCRTLASPRSVDQTAEPPATPSLPASGQKAETPQKEKQVTITVTGHVLDPDGKPVKGARLYWPRMPKTLLPSVEHIEMPLRAKTDAEGRFRFELPRSDIRPDGNLALVAAADGYGLDAVELPKDDSPADLVLHLIKDQPIEGRIVSTEGKPLEGVTVRAIAVNKPQGRLDDFLTAWKKDWQAAYRQLSWDMLLPLEEKSSHAVTDKDGRFRIAGAGSERRVVLRVRGPGIPSALLHVITRIGFDATAVNKATLGRSPPKLGQPGQPPSLYGPKLEYVAAAARIITGTVREAGSGKPVPGYRISCENDNDFDFDSSAVSDNEGRYKLLGEPKLKQYLLMALPPAKSSWLPTGALPADAEGLRPLQVDFIVARGIVVSGRVLDRVTGKGVRGNIEFLPLPGNKFAGKPGYDFYKSIRSVGQYVDAGGELRLAVIPGPGVLMFQARGVNETAYGGQQLNPYKQAEFDAEDRKRVKLTKRGEDRYFTVLDNSIEFLATQNSVKYIDLAADAKGAKCDLFVERGQTMTVKIADADGKPLRGTTVSGLTASWPITFPIQDATCTVFALDPKKPRRLLFVHTERKLAGSLTVRGDEKEPPVARLGRAGSVIGRVLDGDGQPITGADINLESSDKAAGELYRQLRQRQQVVRTGKDGRFRIEGIVPDINFTLNIYRGRTFLIGEPRIDVWQVKADETLDLGAIRVRPAQ